MYSILALYLAEEIEERGLDRSKLKLRTGIFGAEPWTESMRKELEERLGIKAMDIYGLSEIIGPGVAFECMSRKGLHISEDHFIRKLMILRQEKSWKKARRVKLFLQL